MKKGLFVFLLFAISMTALATDFTVCKSKYALCTTAKCTPISGQKGWVSCKCDVKTGYSAGTKSCQAVKESTKGPLVFSRYYPIKSYVVCSNQRPWAWCLDSPCTIDKNNPSKAACKCSVVKNRGDYIIVTNTSNESICTTNLYSSALVTQAGQITDFLKTQKQLQPYRIRVIKISNIK